MEAVKNILIIDDDKEVQSIIKSYLLREGFSVFCATLVKDGVELFHAQKIDLVIIDIFLTDGNGLDLCNRLRSVSQTPIILISAKGDESDKVLGLGLGADDFLTKPFSINELVARVKAQIRRSEYIEQTINRQSPSSGTLFAGPLMIDTASRTAFCYDKPLSLTAKEFDLLTLLVKNENRVFDKEQLYESIWGYDLSGDSRTVMVHIRRLRLKIEVDPNNPKMLVTVWGVGYKFTTYETG
jgi:DNA-binding response OmpR family regulator